MIAAVPERNAQIATLAASRSASLAADIQLGQRPDAALLAEAAPGQPAPPVTQTLLAAPWPRRWDRVDGRSWLLLVGAPLFAVTLPGALLLAGCTSWTPAACAAAMLGACLLACLVLQGARLLQQRLTAARRPPLAAAEPTVL